VRSSLMEVHVEDEHIEAAKANSTEKDEESVRVMDCQDRMDFDVNFIGTWTEDKEGSSTDGQSEHGQPGAASQCGIGEGVLM
jgi:hypothetical protein